MRPRPVRHQAAVPGHQGPGTIVRQREEVDPGDWPTNLERVGLDLEPAALQHYLTLQYVPEPRSLHRHDPARRVRHARHGAPRRGPGAPALLHPEVPVAAVARAGQRRGRGDRARRDRRRAARLGGQAHARRRDRRRVPVRRHRLHGHRGAGQGAQPEPDHVHHRVRARGLLRGRRGRGVRRRDRRAARGPHGQAGRDDGGAAADHLVPRRPGGRPGARPAVVHRPRGPRARQGRALRRGRRRAVRRLHDLPRAAVAGAVREGAGRAAPAARPGVAPHAGGHARQGPAAPRRAERWSSATTATPGSSATTSCAGCCAATTRGVSHTDITAPHYCESRELGRRWPGCSTSTCSPGCAATSWSRPTR